jgi:hypothetical protein
MEIARPAEEAGWSLPEPQDGALTFDLPFTFHFRDRLAVLAFCHRFLEDHGEGGAGRFFASPPVIGLHPHPDPVNENQAVPQLTASIWLKPYDLGVNQTLTLAMPMAEDTREFTARVTLRHQSGSHDAWLRLNHGFVAELRRQFLHWRAVPPTDREHLFEEARAMLLSLAEQPESA